MSTHLSSSLIRALATPSADAACDWVTPMRTRAALADLAAPSLEARLALIGVFCQLDVSRMVINF